LISVVDYKRGWDFKWLNNPTEDRYNYTLPLDSGLFVDWGAVNSTTLQLSVKVPIDEIGDEVTFMTIEGVSLFSLEEQEKSHPLIGVIKRKDTMLIKIGDIPQLQLITNEPEKYLQPGEKAKYKVYVKNNGNVDYMVSLTTSEPSDGWTVSPLSPIDVGSQQSKLVEVFLTAPGEEYNVKAETREMITVEGQVDTPKGVLTSSVGIIGVMDHVYHLNVTVSPAVNTTRPGGDVSYRVTIENLGNGDDEIKLSPLSLELGWNMTFDMGDEFYIDWKESLTSEFKLRVPYNALAGTYTSILNVSDSNPKEKNFIEVKTVVLQSYDIRVGAYNEEHDLYMLETTQYVTPGSSTMYDIKVTNDGNGEDIASLWLYVYKYQQPSAGGGLQEVTKTKEESDALMVDAASSGGVKWHFKSIQSSPGAFSTEPVLWDFSEMIPVDRSSEIRYQPESDLEPTTHASLLLYPGQSAWVQVEVEYPADELLDPMYFAIEAMSAGEDIKLENNLADLKLEIKFSDLVFANQDSGEMIEVIGKQEVNTPQLNIKVTIRNIGEIDARDINIALYIDGQLIDSRTVMRLVNSSQDDYKDILISFAWKPVAGEHKIEVKIDPDNSIVESNENNNVASKKVRIEDPWGVGPGILSDRKICPVIMTIAAVMIMGIVSYYVLRKRKEEQEKM
jgi:hypothetical protein